MNFLILRSKKETIDMSFLKDHLHLDLLVIEYKGAFYALTRASIQAYAAHASIPAKLQIYNPRYVHHVADSLGLHQFVSIPKEIVFGSLLKVEECLDTLKYIGDINAKANSKS
jgi:hypothetical protein